MKYFLIAIAFLSLLSSCNVRKEKTSAKYDITDDLGNKINIEIPSKRIVSLAPNITECIYAIGADSFLVGVTNYCDYPPQTSSKTKIGGIIDPNYEIISALNPSLIIMTVEGNSKPTYQALKNLGVNVFVSNPRSTDGITKTINDIGKICGKEEEAGKLVNKLILERDSLKNLTSKVIPRSCLIAISVNPLISANKTTYINEILELSGLFNIYKEEKLDYPQISYEDVIKKNPEIILFPADTSEKKVNDSFFDELTKKLNTTKAIKENKIFMIDADVLYRPGPRVIEAVRLVISKIR